MSVRTKSVWVEGVVQLCWQSHLTPHQLLIFILFEAKMSVIPPLQVEDRSRLRDPRRAFPHLDTFLPSNTGSYWVKDKRLPPCSLRQALTYFLDITTPPTQLQLHKLARFATEETHRQRLEALCQVRVWLVDDTRTFHRVEGIQS